LRELEARGAKVHGHGHHRGRPFVEHLLGTWRILYLWRQPPEVALAGLYHICYETQFFHRALFSPADRSRVKRLVGARAEALAFLFSSLDRTDLLRQLTARGEIPRDGLRGRLFSVRESVHLSPAELAAVLLIEIANTAEQMQRE